jgi:hypothetical protein
MSKLFLVRHAQSTSVSRLFFNRSKMSVASFNALPHLDRPDYADLVTYG